MARYREPFVIIVDVPATDTSHGGRLEQGSPDEAGVWRAIESLVRIVPLTATWHVDGPAAWVWQDDLMVFV